MRRRRVLDPAEVAESSRTVSESVDLDAQVVEQAQAKAQSEAERIRSDAHQEAEREIEKAKEALRKQVGDLAVLGAARIVKREIDASKHAEVLSDVAAQL